MQNLIQQQDQWAQARGQVDFGLINVYRGLGGGWQIRLQCPPNGLVSAPMEQPSAVQPEVIPNPVPETLPAPGNGNAAPPMQLPVPPQIMPDAGRHAPLPVEPRILQPEKEPATKGASE